jgi:hypothetical protein
MKTGILLTNRPEHWPNIASKYIHSDYELAVRKLITVQIARNVVYCGETAVIVTDNFDFSECDARKIGACDHTQLSEILSDLNIIVVRDDIPNNWYLLD